VSPQAQKRQAAEEAELRECTFQPALLPPQAAKFAAVQPKINIKVSTAATSPTVLERQGRC
jgi:hypothetical protein